MFIISFRLGESLGFEPAGQRGADDDELYRAASRERLSRTSAELLSILVNKDDLINKGYNKATVFWALVGKVRAMALTNPGVETQAWLQRLVIANKHDWKMIRFYSAFRPESYRYYIGDGLDRLCKRIKRT